MRSRTGSWRGTLWPEDLGRISRGSRVWHVVGLHRSVREWAIRQGWDGRCLDQKHAQGILIALASHHRSRERLRA